MDKRDIGTSFPYVDVPTQVRGVRATSVSEIPCDATPSATALVKSYYEAWNRRDVDGVLECFAEDVVYHDTIYLEPKFGKKALAKFFEAFREDEGVQDLRFVVTEYTGDETSCGVAWCVRSHAVCMLRIYKRTYTSSIFCVLLMLCLCYSMIQSEVLSLTRPNRNLGTPSR